MNNIVMVSDLTKMYSKKNVVDHINFSVEEGQMFSLLGANGAGKSTTIDMLCTIKRPDSGHIRICGYEFGIHNREIRRKIGIVFQESLLDPTLTVIENLNFRYKFYTDAIVQNKDMIRRAINITGVVPLIDRYYGTLSGGEKRRVDIARALIHVPKVLILDEPTTGLDPQIRKEIWETIQYLKKKEKMTIIYTTHYMEEVDQADKVALMEKGRIIAQGSPSSLKKDFCHDIICIKTPYMEYVKNKIHTNHYPIKEKDGVIRVAISDSKEALPILQDIRDCLESFEVKAATMEEVFMRICGGKLL